jgi:hypothetical protein
MVLRCSISRISPSKNEVESDVKEPIGQDRACLKLGKDNDKRTH